MCPPVSGDTYCWHVNNKLRLKKRGCFCPICAFLNCGDGTIRDNLVRLCVRGALLAPRLHPPAWRRERVCNHCLTPCVARDMADPRDAHIDDRGGSCKPGPLSLRARACVCVLRKDFLFCHSISAILQSQNFTGNVVRDHECGSRLKMGVVQSPYPPMKQCLRMQ